MNVKKHDLIIAISCLIAGFLLYCYGMPDKVVLVSDPVDSVRTERDTVWALSDPDTIYKPGLVVYRDKFRDRYDTVEIAADTIKTLPFTACVQDTAKIGDTLNVCYKFPENEFSIMRNPQAMMKEIEIQYIYKTHVNDLRTPWWQTGLECLGSFALGFGAGRIK